MKKHEKFNLGNIKLLSGKILKSAQLIYKTYGKLNKGSFQESGMIHSSWQPKN